MNTDEALQVAIEELENTRYHTNTQRWEAAQKLRAIRGQRGCAEIAPAEGQDRLVDLIDVAVSG